MKKWLNDRLKLRQYRRDVEGAYKRYLASYHNGSKEETERHFKEYLEANRKLEIAETLLLVPKASRLGIDLQPGDPSIWTTYPDVSLPMLTSQGLAKLKKKVRDERLSIAEKRAEILAPIIALLTGLAGTIIGIISLLKKC